MAYIPEFIPLEEFENKKIIKRCFQFSAYSFCMTMLYLLFFSLSFPNTIIKQTNQIIYNHVGSVSAYCIQVVAASGVPKYRYNNVTTLLSLSPLTMQSKAEVGSAYGWGKPYFHGLLVVEKKNSIELYNWSYQQRKWAYLEPGFAKKVGIDQPEIICTPQENYLQQIPWIFPKKN